MPHSSNSFALHAVSCLPNGLVHLKRDRHSYSVTYVHISKQALVVYTERLVHIYVENTRVALHSRSLVANKYSTHPEHLASKHQQYGTRSPDYYIKRALDIHPDFHLLVVPVFGQRDRYLEQLYRTCEGLFRLQRSYGETFFKACEIALRNDMLSYKFLERILENGMVEQPQEGGITSNCHNMKISGEHPITLKKMNYKT